MVVAEAIHELPLQCPRFTFYPKNRILPKQQKWMRQMGFPNLNQTVVDALRRKEIGEKDIDIVLPANSEKTMPEKVLQFGTGRFLRGFADFFVDRANQAGSFNGSIVAVQSTGSERAGKFHEQDNYYTVCVNGLQQHAVVEDYRICSAVSRVLIATEDWQAILNVAASPDLQIIISNTTEVGITADETAENPNGTLTSFPGRLTAVLYKRFQAFQGDSNRGLIILPCELIENNGSRLREIVLHLARRWQLDTAFLDWLRDANRFCNTLVDRIITESPGGESARVLRKNLGYQDALFTVAETYSLWAIEGDASLEKQLTFVAANPTVIIRENIEKYRLLKLRLLNGAHTISVHLALLAGERHILDMMRHPLLIKYVQTVMRNEIATTLPYPPAEVADYSDEVLSRFNNPFLRHRLIDITLQSTRKMQMRLVPVIRDYYQRFNRPPRLICAGFAAYLFFMRAIEADKQYFVRTEDELYPLRDDQAGYFYSQWQSVETEKKESVATFVTIICSNEDLWGISLVALPGFSEAVTEYLNDIIQKGITGMLSRLTLNA